jgi:hypothetical protein
LLVEAEKREGGGGGGLEICLIISLSQEDPEN